MSKGCGCQTGILKYFKPPYAKMFHIPCCIHDDDYDIGGGKSERKEADRNLFLRMVKVSIRRTSNPWAVCWYVSVALMYYMGVRLFGHLFFNFTKEK